MALNRNEWKVKQIGLSQAMRLISSHHYSGSASKNYVALHGLFHIEDTYNVLPYGVCWWMPLASPSAAKFYSDDWQNVLSLSRLVLTPDAPKNAASFMLARSIKLLPTRYHTLATYADTWQGHEGVIYKASNWDYRGMTDKKPVWIDRQGRSISIKNGSNTFRIDQMIEKGYEMIGRYAKHRYSYERKTKQSFVQLKLAF